MKKERIVNWKKCGNRIQAERGRLGLSCEELSEQIGLSDKHLSKVENGREALSVDALLKVALALNVSVDYLLTGKEKYMDDQTSLQVLGNKSQMAQILNHCSSNQLLYLCKVLCAALQMYNITEEVASQNKLD